MYLLLINLSDAKPAGYVLRQEDKFMTQHPRRATRDAARENFRKTYCANINPRYSGFFHLRFMLFWGSAVIWLYFSQVSHLGLGE